MTRGRTAIALLIGVHVLTSTTLQAWGGLGHRLIGLIASRRLTPVARQNVSWLLESQSLADVSSWADRQVDANAQTFSWHFVNIPPNAAGYNRDRDCPRQPGAAAGARNDRWRDCAVDRILYFEERLADTALDRADRATALKFLVHFAGDLHQPFHALGVGRGGNDVPVAAFGVTDCRYDSGQPPVPCNLHMIWDSRLVAHRAFNEAQYLAHLEQQIAANGWETEARAPGTPDRWAEESFRLAKDALVKPAASIDERYYQKQIPVVDRRLAVAGLRLAGVLNAIFVAPPPAR